MKLIHTSDWHIGKILCDYSLLEDQSWFLEQFCRQMEQEQPDVILICGDIYDRSVPSADAVALLSSTLERLVRQLGIPVLINAGNHDSGERLGFASRLLESSGLYIAGKVQNPVEKVTLSDEWGPVDFYLLPWFDRHQVRRLFPEQEISSDGEAFRLLMEQPLGQTDRRKVLLAHGFFAGSQTEQEGASQVGGSEQLSLAGMESFQYIALGHIHGARSAGLPQARYSGSPLKYSVDEQHQPKQYLSVQLDGQGQCQIQSVPVIPLRDVRTVSGSFQQVMSREYHQNQRFEDYVMVSLTDRDPVPDVMTRLKALFPNILGVQFPEYTGTLFEHAQTASVLESLSGFQLFEQFYCQTTGESLTPQQAQLIAQLMEQLERSENR